MKISLFITLLSIIVSLIVVSAKDSNKNCADLPCHSTLKTALTQIVNAGGNAGLNTNMWATIVNDDGVICAIAYSGEDRHSQWLASRIISAQKAFTANSLSLPNLALSTANLYAPTQPGASLYSLTVSNLLDSSIAYAGDPEDYGTTHDPLIGEIAGGIIVFGGGLGLYNNLGVHIGGVGVSGDTSCGDHNIVYKLRHALNLDYVPGGVSPDATHPDSIIFDIDSNGHSPSGYGHPHCSANVAAENNAADSLPSVRQV